MLRLLFFFSFLFLILQSYFPLANAAKSVNSPSEWVVDTDLGPDDALALLYLLSQPAVRIKAITLEMTGSLSCQEALDRAALLLKIKGQSHIPLACGRDQPLRGTHRSPKSARMTACVNWPKSYLPSFSIPKQKQNAKDLMIQTFEKSQGPINLLAIAPLTTLAEVFEERPDLKKKIRRIYIMGGAIKVSGNVQLVLPESPNQRAEWNFYLDPFAAEKIFQSGIALTLVPLDLTNPVSIDVPFYQNLKTKHRNAAARFAYALLKQDPKRFVNSGCYLWDPITAVIATRENVATFKTLSLSVRQAPEALSGATILDPLKGSRVRVTSRLRDKEAKNELLNGLYSINDIQP